MVMAKFEALSWRGWGKQWRTSVRRVDVLAEIWCEHLQNRRQKHYCFSQLAWSLQYNITQKHTHFILHLLIATNHTKRLSPLTKGKSIRNATITTEGFKPSFWFSVTYLMVTSNRHSVIVVCVNYMGVHQLRIVHGLRLMLTL